MKEHDVSQSIAPPTTVPIEIQPTADELMTDWLAQRIQAGINIVIDAAARTDITIREISVFGHDYYDNSYRTIVIWVVVDAQHDEAYDYWGVIAGPINDLNQPPPRGAANADVRIDVTVDW
jgi:hypothetical protein